MSAKPTSDEIMGRIRQDVIFFKGTLPERVTLTWYGYLAALLEWDLISPHDHHIFTGMLPHIPDNPVVAILIGREKNPADDLGLQAQGDH